MITLRPAESRGHIDFGWLDTHHTFSFGDYFDPEHTQFRALRVLNEDRVQPGRGFGTHSHRDMEILTWVLSGALEHRDSLGTHGVIRPGEAQVMSAGTGIRHSEFNASAAEPVHFLQIWILPERQGLAPRYDQVAFQEADLRNHLHLIASPDGADGSVRLFQDVKVFAARLDAGREIEATIPPGRAGFLQVAAGSVTLQGRTLNAGDAARIEGEPSLAVVAGVPAEILFFDLA
ncbi:MAG: pirin family protein [Geothrix sp.]|uniref:pirin family protein n=1 Tax=Geothrix sp. TaxID=1962974 RepID=UPI0017A4B256|nr:pirin family protein [Geothrix sp.]NWJ39676.1 pirin family protein [Geothrix sp.]WIL22305.1 MAG: pirin family protein [Geothrix sp.]